jgi:hypothetical protein
MMTFWETAIAVLLAQSSVHYANEMFSSWMLTAIFRNGQGNGAGADHA